MKKAILLFLLYITFGFSTIPEADVYICDSTNAYAYHKTDKCAGIKNCNHTIKQVTISDAKDKYKRKACKKCY